MERLAIAKRGLVLALCGYECISVATGRVPTITTLSGKYRALGPALVLGLAVHLAYPPAPKVTVEVAVRPEGI